MNILILGKLDEGQTIAQLNKQLTTLQGKINQINLSSSLQSQQKTFTQSINTATAAIQTQSVAMSKNKKQALTMVDEIGIALQRVPTWLIATTAVFQTMRFFTHGVAYVNDLNKAMTEVSVVTGKNQTQVSALGLEYQKLAYEMSVTTKEIADASVTFYRQGLSQEEVMDRVRVATMYAKISNIDFALSSEQLTASINSMGRSAEDVADIFTLLGDITASSPDEIGAAMQKAGGSMNALNIPLERAAAYIATISSKTREAGEVIGTAFKSMASRYSAITQRGFNAEDGTTLNQVARALEDIGIQSMGADKQLRNLPDVLDDLHGKWDTLDQKQRSYIATTVAGRHHISRFYSLMDDYGLSLELYDAAMSASGTTQQKYNLQLQSTDAYLAKLKTSYTGIWQSVFNSDDIRTAISLLTSLTNGLGVLTKTFGLFPTIVPLATATLVLFNASAKTFIANLGLKLVGFLGLGPAIASATLSLGLYTGAMGAATKAGMLFYSVVLPIAIIAATTVAVTKLAGALSKMSEANRVAKMEEENAVKTYKTHGAEIEKLNAKYKELTSLTTRTAEQDTELEKTKKRLAQILPSVTTALDVHGNVHIRTAEKIDEELIKVRELLTAYENLDKKLKEQEVKRAERQVKATQDTLLQLQRDLSALYANPDLYPEDEMRTREQYLKDEIDRLSESLGLLREKAELTKDVASIITPDPDPNTTGVGPTSTPTIFDLSLRKIELVDAELAKLQHSLELVTNQEERQTIYDQMIAAYKQKQALLSQMLTWQKQEMANAQTVLKKSVNANDYRNIINGKFDNLPVYSQAVSDAISKWQSLSSEVLKTESSLREVEIAYTRLGQTAQTELQAVIDKQINLSFYLIDEEISNLQRIMSEIKDAADLRIKAIQSQIDAIEDVNRALKEQEDREKRLNEIIALRIQLRNEEEIEGLEKIKERLKEVADLRLSALQSQIDALNSADDLTDEQQERERRINDLLELQIQLRNTLNEENIRQLQQQEDGTWQYVYAADQNKIDQINKDIQHKQQDFDKWEADTRKRKEITRIQDEMQSIRDELELETKKYDAQIELLRNHLSKVDNIREEIKKKEEELAKWEDDLRNRKHIDALRDDIEAIRKQLEIDTKKYDDQITNLQNFVTAYKEAQGEFYGQTINGLEQFMIDLKTADGEGYSARLGELKLFISRYNAMMRTIVSPLAAPLIPVGTGGGGGNVESGGQINIAQFDSGGYTGMFKGGKLGVLHEQELILNKDDTKNMLYSITLARDIMSSFKQFTLPTMNQRSQETIVNVGNLTFPNVTNGNDVIETLKSLPRIALQERYTPSFQRG